VKKPELWFAEIVMRCPDGERTIRLPATSGAAAIAKGLKFKREDASQAFMRQRCVKVGVRVLPRGAGAGLAGGKAFQVYKGKGIQKLLPSGYYEIYSDSAGRFLKFDRVSDAKAYIARQQRGRGRKKSLGQGVFPPGIPLGRRGRR